MNVALWWLQGSEETLFVSFHKRSHVAQAGLKFFLLLNVTLNISFFCLQIESAWITLISQHNSVCVYVCVRVYAGGGTHGSVHAR